ncbi:related to BUD7 protein [Cephalotrichum gorgonifer]|uniref:Related to BUD7 protein n=1 Tax=Cephalotrichum gorgonifer TaxID=2041049 RepID=A0AAE8N3C6_9PEZI|nr:related to BUD7 protein [Cephalotrichum gorgonifer]
MVAPAIPELSEEVLHESIDARTESLISLRELGPPDLIHLLKQATRNPNKQIGVYHHVTGVDASSSASLAAYINTLTHSEPHGQQTQTKVVEGLYCCYNAFSRLDMRVHVTIPGSVEAYCVDERGEQRKATDELWLETYLCSVLRAYSYADDGSGETIRKIMGVRRFNPVTNTESEHRFLSSAEQLFFRGSDSIVQVPNNVSNHLTTGLLKYFETTGRYASGINLFEKLRTQNVEVSSLLAKVLFMGNEEVRGIRVLHEALKETPMDYAMLDAQAEFLLKKAKSAATPEQREERLQLARECADRSTIAAPSEFRTWARLAQVYVAMEDWEHALAVLNSCPMFTYQDKDAPVMPEPKDVYLPTLPATRLDEIDSEPESRYSEQVDPSLLGLRAATYKGTFREAYNILTEMTAKLGWDQLLKIRSSVFVMEDEYRNEKETVPGRRNASTDGLRGTPRSSTDGSAAGADGEKPEGKENGEEDTSDDEKSDSTEKAAEKKKPITNGNKASPEKPSNVIDPDEAKADAEKSEAENPLSKLNNKRLCERWLDSLFMVLYEDLRVYTIWRTQMAQYRAQSMQYKKSAEEWEILGSLSARLQHAPEAAEAYRACLGQRFSPKALAGILAGYEREGMGATREMLGSLIRLVTWQYRWYSEFSPELLRAIRVLIEEEGALKVRSVIQATSMPQGCLDLTHHYAALCATFRSSGTDG